MMLETCLALCLLLSLNDFSFGSRFITSHQPRVIPQESSPVHSTKDKFKEIEGLMVRRVEFVGNTYTPDAPVRRALGLTEGDSFTLKQLKRGLWRVNRLGFFKQVTTNDVEWHIDRERGEVDFSISFKEKRRRRP